MLLVKTANGEVEQFPYTLGELRRDNPNTSFPKHMENELLEIYGVYPVSVSARPSNDELVQTIVRNLAPTQDSDGNWSVGYTVENKSQNQAETNVRNKRDSLLSETDWTALSDNTMSTEMVAYRQALRDITAQEGFPYDVTWPTKPAF